MLKSFAFLGCCLLALSLSAQLTIIVEQWPANTPDKDTLFLGGELNKWAAADLDYQFRRDSTGRYYLTLPNEKNSSFEYKVTRGSWKQVETDFFGQFLDNHRYKGNEDTIRLEISSWDDLPITPPYGWINIIIESVPENTPPGVSLYAVGSFNAWHPGDPSYQLSQQDDGRFKVRIPLIEDTTYYKFSRGSWETIEGRPNGRARVNRQFILKENSTRDLTVRVESWEDLAGNPINWYTFILLLAAFQGILLILAINTLQNDNRAANRILSVLLLVLSIALVGRVSTYDREIFNWLPRLLLLPDFIYFLYAPVFLIYINRLLRQPSRKTSGIQWWQFIPLVLQLAVYIPLILMSKKAFITDVVDQDLKSFFAWTGGLALIYNTIYWFVCRRTIQQYEQESEDNHAFEPNLEFLRMVMWLKFACLIIWISTYFIGGFGWLTKTDLSFITDKTTDMIWAVFALTTFFLGYYTMRQPEIFKLPAPDTSTSVEKQVEQEKAASMNDDELTAIKKKLEQAMRESQPYCNAGLSLNKLAELVGATPHSLSRVINEGFGMNFNDFVNSYRIEEFKRLIRGKEYEHYTLLAIAFTVGFNSKSAFNRSFKKMEDCTPREYLKGVMQE